MAEKISLGENTVEEVAYRLFKNIADCERRNLNGVTGTNSTPADRDYILSTYAEALDIVRGAAYKESK